MYNSNSLFDKTKPLWLPEGSIRAILALGVVGLVGTLLALGRPTPEWLAVWAVVILQNYFNHRDKVEEGVAKVEEKKVEVMTRAYEKTTDTAPQESQEHVDVGTKAIVEAINEVDTSVSSVDNSLGAVGVTVDQVHVGVEDLRGNATKKVRD